MSSMPEYEVDGSVDVEILEPTRLRILKALTSLIGTAKFAGGTLEDCVFRGRTIYGDEDPLPMVSILEAPIPLEGLKSGGKDTTIENGKWELLLQGWTKDDRENPTDPGHFMLAAVKQVIAKHKSENTRRPNLLSMGKFVTDIHIGQGAVRPSDEISNKAYFWLVVTIHVVDNLKDPYA